MLTYATGRILEPIDRGETDRIATELAQKATDFVNWYTLLQLARYF